MKSTQHSTGHANGTAYYMSRSADVWKSALRRPRPQSPSQSSMIPSMAEPNRTSR